MAFGFKFGGGQSPIEKLASGKLKDDEKQLLLTQLTQANPPSVELVPLLCLPDAAIASKAVALFIPKADAEGVRALLADLLERTIGVADGIKVLQRCKEDLLLGAIEPHLAKPRPDTAKRLWEITLELPAAISDKFLERALSEAPGPPRLTALSRIIKLRGPEGSRKILIEASSNRETSVRKEALRVLSGLEGEDVFATMLDRLGADDSKDVRAFAAQYLQQYIHRSPPDVRPKVLGRLLLAGDAQQRTELVKTMFTQGSSDGLLHGILVFCKTLTGIQHRTIMDALKAVGETLVQPALAVLKEPTDADLRVQAVYLLETFADPRTVGPLLALLRDADWWVRIVVCETLGRMRDPMIIEPLREMFNDPDAKWAAIEAVGRIGGEKAVTVLLPLLGNPSNEVRLAVVNTMRSIKDPRVTGALTDVAAKDTSMDVRLKAVDALNALKGGDRKDGAVLSSADLSKPIEKMLALTRERGGSDLIITPGEPPVIRVNSSLERLQADKLDAEQTKTLLMDLLDPVRKPMFEQHGAVDFCYAISGVGRYRANLFKMKRGISGAFRCISNQAPTFAELGLPKHLSDIGSYHQGIVLVTGPAGSGKTTTLTALVDFINDLKTAHILTFEDPIEFVHTAKKSLINQREIGKDTQSYAAAMRGALREDPDVVVVGDMRDPETIRLALLASETGHLVVATMQTTGAVATIDKLVESFPTEEQHQVRVGLSESLKLVVSQVLVPRVDGKGRVGVFEVLKSTSSVRSVIREGKTYMLPSTMVIGKSVGMQTLDSALEDKVRAGLISFETAMYYAQNKDGFAKMKMTASTPAPSSSPPAQAQQRAPAVGPAPGVVAQKAPVARPAGSPAHPPGVAPAGAKPAVPPRTSPPAAAPPAKKA